MVSNKSLDEVEVIAALLQDAHASYGDVFNSRALRLTCQKVRSRARSEGLSFLTKTMPRLCKVLDKALTGVIPMNRQNHGFDSLDDGELPRFLGEFFMRIFHLDGTLLPNPDAQCVAIVRNILTCYYKYELPYTEDQEHEVLQAFIKAEEDLTAMSPAFSHWLAGIHRTTDRRRAPHNNRFCCEAGDLRDKNDVTDTVIREARILLSNVFSLFDPYDIVPRHGPGVVATKQKLWDKFRWTNVSDRITSTYPFDAYFCATLGHVCDVYDRFDAITNTDHPARVILVPKDSRGPRLISCEPVDFQWIQQGLQKAIYRLVEHHPLTREHVFFTDQRFNQRGALLGSTTGRYATLDLKEASDRVSLDLVRLLFPEHLHRFLEASRSLSTVLPNGQELTLKKFAPMGSALCFPIMALTIWAILTARAPNADTRECIYVYGDDVIVPTTFVESAISILEEFGLKINRSKSCTQGFFRESCGVDAFHGIDVTPVRFRTVWDTRRRANVYESYIAYANALFARRCYNTYNLIVSKLEAVYGPIPDKTLNIECPSLVTSSARHTDFRTRTNKALQKREYKVWVTKSPTVSKEIDGWSMLLRYFTEFHRKHTNSLLPNREEELAQYEPVIPSAVSQYTRRRTSMLVRRWR